MIEKPKIKAAAVLLENGMMFSGETHEKCWSDILKEIASIMSAKNGFVDEDNAFLTRREAYERAVLCGQIKDDGGERLLFSEMLTPEYRWVNPSERKTMTAEEYT